MALINDFLSLIYPNFCQACGAHLYSQERHLCRLCRLNLPKSNFHKNPQNAIALLLGGRVPVQRTLCLYLFEKNGRVQKLVHAIKYHRKIELARELGGILGEEYNAATTFLGFDAIVPVPLHEKKLKQRGYNQSAEFAQGLSKSLGVPVLPAALKRVKASSTQTRKKKFERWENVEGIFEAGQDLDLSGKHLLLVDDVVTTGATLEAAWMALRNFEDVKVSVGCIAFAKTQQG